MRFTAVFIAAVATLVAALPGAETKALTFPAPDEQLSADFKLAVGARAKSLAPGEHDIVCNPPNWGEATASCFYLREGIQFLREKKRSCETTEGELERVSCSWGAGIFVQNLLETYQEYSCKEIADLTEKILQRCGGDKCMTDMKKPGKCITGYLVTRTFGVIVALQNC